MRTLFAIIFSFSILFLCALIISLIPISIIGDNVAKQAKNHKIEFTTKSSWNFRLIGLKGTTSKFEYSFNVGKSQISGHGENFIYGLVNGKIHADRLTVDIHLDEGDTFGSIIDFLKKEQIVGQYYSFDVKNLIINIYTKDEYGQEKPNNEIILNDVKVVRQKKFEAYMADIGISKDKKNTVLVTINNPDDEKYEFNAKVENDNCLCYIYDTKKEGNINCLMQNFLISMQDLSEKEVENGFYRKLLDKRVSLKANITHGDITRGADKHIKIVGKLMINNNTGDINFDSKDNSLDVSFDNLDLSKTTNDVRNFFQNEFEKEQNLQVMAMSGKENKILLNSAKKDNLENANSLSKIALYLIEYTKNINMQIQLNAKKINIESVPIKNFTAKLSKKEGEKINLDEISAIFGENFDNNILIKNRNDQIGNLSIDGRNVSDFLKLLNFKKFNQNLNTNSYRIKGNVSLSTNSIEMENISWFLNEIKILNYNYSKTYDRKENKNVNNSEIVIQNIDLSRYFNFKEIFKNLYDDFDDFQQQEKQDAIFWKHLFEKRHKKCDNVSKQTLLLSNSLFYDKKINYLALEYEDSKSNTKIDIASSGEIMDGRFHYNIKNIDEKETMDLDLEAKNINLNFNETFFDDIKEATNRNFSKIFYEDKDYNIPSLMGLNGVLNVKIDNLIINDDNAFYNAKGKFELHNGVIKTEGLLFKYCGGEIVTNMVMSLQGQPELKLAFSGSGLLINDLIKSPLDGYVSFQCNLKTFGFNPIKFVQGFSGNGRFIVQNITIPKFNLLNMSSEIITNGIRNNYDYKNLVSKSSLSFAKGEGNLFLENGILKGDLSLSRELVSGSVIFEYGIFTKILRQISGSFAVMMAKKRLSTPFPIYIPFACNGNTEKPDCVVNWEQLDDVLANVYQPV